MKKQFKLLALIAIALVAILVLVSCNKGGDETKAPSGSTPPTSESTPGSESTSTPDASVPDDSESDSVSESVPGSDESDSESESVPGSDDSDSESESVPGSDESDSESESTPGSDESDSESESVPGSDESESDSESDSESESEPDEDDFNPEEGWSAGLDADGKYTVRFMAYDPESDPEDPKYILFCDVKVAPGKRARPDGRPEDIRGWEWDLTWSADLKDVQQGMIVYANYTQLAKHFVTFVDNDGNPIAGYENILRYDGERINADAVPTVGKVPGKYFAGWSLVTAASDTATAEALTTSYTKGVTADMVLKAYYPNTTAIAPYVTETIVVDGYMDEAYQKYSQKADGSYFNAVPFFTDTTGTYVTDGGSGDDKNTYKNTSFWKIDGVNVWPDTTADTYVVWDGSWIYFMVEVEDNTLGTRSPAYIINTPNAYQNDTVEFWYNFEQNLNSVTNKMKVGIDAFGLRQFGTPDNQKSDKLDQRSMSWWFKYIRVATSVLLDDGTWTSVRYDANSNLIDKDNQPLDVADVANKFRVEIAIPALTEPTVGDPDSFGSKTLEEVIEDELATGHTNLEAYDVLRICLQSNDVKAWTAEDAEGNAIVDAGKGESEPKFYSVNFAAGGRTQYYYPVYDSISLAAEGDYTAE